MRSSAAATDGNNTMIFKIVGREDWDAATREGVYCGSPDDVRDGFIHFSTADQLVDTAARHFRGMEDLVLVAFDEGTLGEALKWEPSRGGQLFPHLYGSLPTGLALWVRPMPLAEDGVPRIPEGIAAC